MNKSECIGYLKLGTRVIATAGVSKIISGVIETNVVRDGKLDKILVIAGAITIKMIAGEIVAKHSDEALDNVFSPWVTNLASADNGA